MKTRFNWLTWASLFVSVIALLSYPLFFVNFPVTRDFPWVNLLLFGIAAVLLVLGIKRGFAAGRPRRSKIAASILATLSFAIIALFIFSAFIMARWLPASHGAPQVGQKSPEFTLSDSTGKQTSLAELLSTPVGGTKPRGVLLVFYRGYW
ncbi:MAG: hypothetical protein JWM21_375 [Acidobacteria bacterium]|nr:hypothetical protein [Acidobacteriota bacterium]